MYRRFESFVAFVLTIVIGAIILVALVRLIVSVADTLVLRTLNPLDHTVFQRVFGEVMTLLIALEFNHTLRYVVSGERGIIHTKMVLLIALLALARRVIVMDLVDTDARSMGASWRSAIAGSDRHASQSGTGHDDLQDHWMRNQWEDRWRSQTMWH